MNTSVQIADAVAATDFGAPTARKTGRNPAWPYVPVVLHGDRQEQILGKAFATRPEAVAHATKVISHRRTVLARQLADLRYRALREAHGLPRELAQ